MLLIIRGCYLKFVWNVQAWHEFPQLNASAIYDKCAKTKAKLFYEGRSAVDTIDKRKR